MLLNRDVAKDLRIPWTAMTSNQSFLKESDLNILWVDWFWSWNSNTLDTWCEELTHLKRPWCWEWLKVGREGDNRGWNGWITSLTQWTWVCVNSGSWWWTGRPGCCDPWGCRVGHDRATELDGTSLVITFLSRSKRLLISWLQSPSAVILEPRKIKSATVSTVSLSICH